MKILVLGAGAVGVYFGAKLAQGGAEVSVVVRSEAEVVSRQGGYKLVCEKESFFFQPKQIFRSPAEAINDDFDYVIFACKVLPEVNRPQMLKEALGNKAGKIILISNGIDIEAEVAKALPKCDIISAIAYIGASRPCPGTVKQIGSNRLELGTYPATKKVDINDICAIWEKQGVKCAVSENIQVQRWNKLLWNLPFNPVSVLSGGLDTSGMCDRGDVEKLCIDLMLEIIDVANAYGIKLSIDDADKQIEFTRNFPPYKTSMLQDFEADKPLEVEAILGNFVRMARKQGIRVAHAETCYALLKAIDMIKRESKLKSQENTI